MRVLGVLAALAVFAAAAPAHAEFAFTKWGMTKEQVIAAGGGQVVMGPKSLKLKDGYTLAGVHFARVGFAFEEGQLWGVAMDTPDVDFATLTVKFAQAYGKQVADGVYVDLVNNYSISVVPVGDNVSIAIRELPPAK